jgi:malate synthase
MKRDDLRIPGIQLPPMQPNLFDRILTPQAMGFVAHLHRKYEERRRDLMKARAERQARLDAGETLGFLPETRSIREAEWTVGPVPADLQDRRVEITGPVERKMVINALNSGASTFMADFEDSCTPSWDNMIQGQINLRQAIDRSIGFKSPEGKCYQLNEKTATLIVRPRGLHMLERHVLIDGDPISASIFDFGIFFFHNAEKLVANGTGPYFYLPKIESHLEARLWDHIFNEAETRMNLARGTIKATVLIETLARSLRDGRDPLRAARPFRRAQLRALGLHLQLHQETAEARLRLRRPRAGHDDEPLPACLLPTAGEDLPSSWRARHGRHGRADSNQERREGQ